jgi:hypothetical protein
MVLPAPASDTQLLLFPKLLMLLPLLQTLLMAPTLLRLQLTNA